MHAKFFKILTRENKSKKKIASFWITNLISQKLIRLKYGKINNNYKQS